jgi:hypothetical protein
MHEEEVLDKWVGKIVKMISPLNDYIKVGEVGKCVDVYCDCDGDIYLDVIWGTDRQTSFREYRHEVVQ